jgi:excisionase family DNA binding protein
MILDSMEVACSQAENLPIVHNNFSVFREGLQRTYTRGRTAMSSAYTQPGSEIFHEWRKRAKYLWHQIEILEALWPKVFTMMADELHTLSDYLGDDHDLAVLRAMILNQVKGFGDERELMRLVSLIDRERLELEALARPLGERLYFDSPKTFVQRLETYWKAWQAEDQERQARLIKRIRQASPTYLLEETPWLTTAAMAEILKITPDKVRQFIQEQKLPAEKVGNIWVIKAEGFLTSEPLGNETATNANLLMGTREAAQRLNLTPIQIRDLIQAGELAAAKVGRIWVIREQDLSILL